MSAPVAASGHEPPADDDVYRALHVVADGLTAHGFDTRSPTWERSYHLDVTNVRGALCEVNLAEGGKATWEYRRCHSCRADPMQIVDMVTSVLGAGDRGHRKGPARYLPDLTLKGVVGRALVEHGMSVCLREIHRDDVNFEIYAEIEAANPADPGRGKVRVADDGTIRWECSFHDLVAAADGLQPSDIAEAIARALARQDA
jgi:hypothetical protein